MSKPDKTIKKGKSLTKELQHMMYSFGDVENPLPESVDLMESICIEYISEMTRMTASIAGARITKKEVLFAIRKNKKQQNRARELMIKQIAIDKIRKSAKEHGDAKLV
mmetsp:Transcript_105413/g.157806  ORF Transcript_105413/g.157806 Transcript_105413/m.157806 type:complete len:108 (+) Transcript_105413:46-369(+)